MSKRNIIIETGTELVTEVCVSCGTLFAMSKHLNSFIRRERPGTMFYCPNGHGQHYTGKSNEQRAKELERELNFTRDRNRHLNDQLEQSERSKAAIKGHYTRMKNRVDHGVCPYCKRHFDQLENHIHDKHPEQAGA